MASQDGRIRLADRQLNVKRPRLRHKREATRFAITVCALFNFYKRRVDATGVHAMSDEAHRKRATRSAEGYAR